MQLALILAVLAALAISEDGPSEPVGGAGYRLAVVLAGMMLVALFAAVASGVTAYRLRRGSHERSVLMRRFRRLRQVHVALWLATAGGILWWLDWGQLVRFNWHLDHVFLVDDVLILMPVVLPMVLSWAAFYEVDRALRVGLSGDAALEGPPASRRQYLGVHLRHYLGVLLLPVLGLLAVQDAVDLVAPGLLESDWAVAIYGPAFLLLFLLFPVMLRHLWQTRPLEQGTLRSRLEKAAGRSGLGVRDVLVWQTGGLLVNAAVAGFAARLRYVFLTDGLLARLDEDEIEAVFDHELGHVRHRHLLLRILAMIAPLSLWLLAGQLAPESGYRVEAWLARAGLGLQVPMGLAIVAVMGVYMFFVFGFYSRLLEHQADLFACRAMAAGSSESARETFVSALEKLTLAAGTSRKATGWQHASIARRVELLRQAAEEPRYLARFERRVRSVNLVLIAAVLSPAAWHVLLG